MSDPRRNKSYPKPAEASAAALHDAVASACRVEEDAPHPMQIEIYRRMTGQQRLTLAERMFWEAREIKAAGVRHHHPDWPEEQVTAEVNRIFLNART